MQTPSPYSDPNNAPDSRAEKINTIWKIAALIYTLGATGLVMYWEFTDSGLCLVIREWQGMILDEKYYPVLDIALALLILIVPLLIVKLIVEKITGVKITHPH